MVLMKGFDKNGIVFFTNYSSRKGNELVKINLIIWSLWQKLLHWYERRFPSENWCSVNLFTLGTSQTHLVSWTWYCTLGTSQAHLVSWAWSCTLGTSQTHLLVSWTWSCTWDTSQTHLGELGMILYIRNKSNTPLGELGTILYMRYKSDHLLVSWAWSCMWGTSPKHLFWVKSLSGEVYLI